MIITDFRMEAIWIPIEWRRVKCIVKKMEPGKGTTSKSGFKGNYLIKE
ncbi:Uncharacterised protein [Chlamydia abortus]|nr:Uncharacterised protein [Chlamydia abortus]